MGFHVTPLGDVVPGPRSGTVFGNRGRLHEDGEIVRHHRGNLWIACRLEFKGRHREPAPAAGYTGVFFLDDATALAGGHRPCGECRHDDYRRFADLWPGPAHATAINRRLHAGRLTPDGAQRHHEAAMDDVPDGVFVLRDDAPWLVLGERLRRWTVAGYADTVARPRGETAVVITPRPSVDVLRAGWRPAAVPFLHGTA